VACSAPSPPTGADRLRAATEAVQNLRSVTYRYTYRGTGSLAGAFDGSVRLVVAPGRGPTYWAELRPSPSWQADDRDPGAETPVLVLSAGSENVGRRDEATLTLRHGTLTGGSGHLVANAPFAVLFQLTERDPFASELGGELTLGDQETIGGVLCDVVQGTNAVFGDAAVTWYIAVEDDLPRAHRFVAGDGSEYLFQIEDLDTHSSVSMQSLAIETQSGDLIIDEDARPIEVGAVAPDWALSDADGRTVRLSDFRGSIVVLDVGASWCTQCQTLSAAYSQIAESRFAESGVQFLGVNTWESPDLSADDVVRRAGVDYPTLFGGEAIAMDYKLATVPALFVVDRDGRFVLLDSPVSSGVEATGRALETVLDALVEGGGP